MTIHDVCSFISSPRNSYSDGAPLEVCVIHFLRFSLLLGHTVPAPCKALTSQGLAFSPNISSTFSLSLDKEALSSKAKNKASLSTLSRNMNCRQEFFYKMKAKPSEAENGKSDKEVSQNFKLKCHNQSGYIASQLYSQIYSQIYLAI